MKKDLMCKCGHSLGNHNLTCCNRTNLEKNIICDYNFHCVCLVKVDEKC